MGECNESFWASFFSTLSLVSWMGAQLPQIYTNYKNKSADGISPTFLLLWFLGDFLSFTSCLLNDVVLKFQIYLSLFFLANDLMLCFQYYYYNSVFPTYTPIINEAMDIGVGGDSEINKTTATAIHIRSDSTSLDGLKSSTNSPTTSYNSTMSKLVTASLIPGSNALSLVKRQDSGQHLGLFLAWSMTFVYMASRCPQLYKNYQRKSVEGINPLFFGSALIGNLTYTLSILTSCEFLYNNGKLEFFLKELPYILGSSGTILFDILYFYQRHLYRDAGRNTHVIGLENWQP